MAGRTIHITNADMQKLTNLIEGLQGGSAQTKQYLEDLEKELNRAKVTSPKKIPKDVITMNSEVRLQDLDSSEVLTYTVVFPAQANIEKNKISILAPIGTALLGYRVGDIVEWSVPSGRRRLKVQEVLYQPEAAGDYDL
ncbi:MAG: nucleoside diphosphate kinase regulator [Proteobacteria bacterium]|nr:nucleoside diphosphate kinase regulator [Pseudomonadota bacterium]